MGRNAYLTIQNNTGFVLTYQPNDTVITHGKLTSTPPATIEVGGSGYFSVSNKASADIGPQGNLTYQLTIDDDTTISLIFYWNHPWGSSSSAYTVGSNPANFATYYLVPQQPTGHDQTVTYNVSLSDSGVNPCQWMTSLGKTGGGDILLRNLLIPGSHDSGTYEIENGSAITLDCDNKGIPAAQWFNIAAQWSKSQPLTIYEQLNQGIRFFDLRISEGVFTLPFLVYFDVPKVCHSMASASPDDVFSDIQKFTEEYPQEVIIINLSVFRKSDPGDTFYQSLFDKISNTFGSRILERSTYNSLSTLTLQDIWNLNQQVILLMDKDCYVPKLYNITRTPFETNFSILFQNNQWLGSSAESLNNHWPNKEDDTDLENSLASYITNYGTNLNMLFVLQGIESLSGNTMFNNVRTGTIPTSLQQLGNHVSPLVMSWVVNQWSNSGLNIILLDWINDSFPMQLCYMINLNNNPNS